MQPPSQQPALPDLAFRLPNARAGSAYSGRIEALDGDGPLAPLVFDELLVPAGLPLAADLESGTLGGTPSTAGDYRVTVVYRYAGETPARQRRAHVCLTVTPDPRSMWKTLPSDRQDPYWKDDAACEAVRGPELAILAASKRGRSHAHVGGFRDDDYRIAHLGESGWYLAAVADGAGSAKYSRRGAALICETVSAHVRAALDAAPAARLDAAADAYAQALAAGDGQRDALRTGLQTALSRIVGNAAYYAASAIMEETRARPDLDGAFKDYASTALIGICKRYPFGILCAAYWVGDGAVGVYSKRDGVTLLGEVDSGEFAGQTRFLDGAAIGHDMLLKRTRFALVEDMTAFVLMTDGVSDAQFETEARLARAPDWHAFWDELDAAVRFSDPAGGQERRLLDWLDFWSQGNHDDRTIAIIF